MRIKEIISPYINPNKIDQGAHDELVDALERHGPTKSLHLVQAMYGISERDDLEIEQLRADLHKTKAEIDKLRIAAMRDQAEIERVRAISSTEGSSASSPTQPDGSARP